MMFGLLRDSAPTPRTVTVEFRDESLLLIDSNGAVLETPYAKLSTDSSANGVTILRKGWPSAYSLTLTRQAADMAIATIGEPRGWPARAGRWIWGNGRLVGFGIAGIFFLIDHVPAKWIVAATPAFAEARIDAPLIERIEASECNSPAGKNAVAALIRKLGSDPANLRVLNIPADGYLIAARPGKRVIIAQNAVAEADNEVLAALLAHELSHVRHDDPFRAAARWEGGSIWFRMAFPYASDAIVGQDYTAAEERRADREALDELLEAQVDLEPVAKFFALSATPGTPESLMTRFYTTVHPIKKERLQHWQDAAVRQRDGRPALDRERTDDLYNICWDATQIPRE
ncbi:MAG: M48 family metalloprotease [Sphingomicrobium sp.]